MVAIVIVCVLGLIERKVGMERNYIRSQTLSLGFLCNVGFNSGGSGQGLED